MYEKERASRIEGRDTDQHNRHCQPTRSSRFYVCIWISPLPSPGPGPEARPDHSYSPPPSRSRSLIVSAHTAPSVIPTLSRQLHPPPVSSHSRSSPLRRLFIGLPAFPPPNTVAYHTLALAPCPKRALCPTSDAARHKALVLSWYIIVFRIFCSFCIDEYI